jgi:hypothetical protein
VLFTPFDLEKWFVLAFSAWLAYLGEGGWPSSRFNWNIPGGDEEYDSYDRFDGARFWLLDHLDTILVIAVIVVPLFIALSLVLFWITSRMKFVFVDCVVRNRAAVVKPWHDYRTVGNSLFIFRVILGMVVLLLVALLLAMMFAAIWPAVKTGDFSAASVILLLLALFAFIALAFVLCLVQLAMNDLVVPVMYVRGCRVGQAWREAGHLIGLHAGPLFLYVLLRIVLSVALGLLAFLSVCATCFIAMLPYLGTVILLPLYVFVRSYALHFFSQFDPAFAALRSVPAASTPDS